MTVKQYRQQQEQEPQLICQEEQRRSPKTVEQLIRQGEQCRQEMTVEQYRQHQEQEPQLIGQEELKMTVEQYRQHKQGKWVAQQQQEQQLIRQEEQQPQLCGEQQQEHIIEQLVKQLIKQQQIKQQRPFGKVLPRSQSVECFVSQLNSSLTAQAEETPLCKLVSKIIAEKQQLSIEETLEQKNVPFKIIYKVQKVLEQHHNMQLSIREVSQLTIKQLSAIEQHTEHSMLKRQCQALFYFVEQCAQHNATEKTRFVQELMKLATAEQRIRLTLKKLMSQQAELDLSQTEETLYTLLHKVNTVAYFNQMPTLKCTQVLLVKPAQHQTENRQVEAVKEQRVERLRQLVSKFNL
jgi:hypothetical protein